jgi:rubrerythrin
MSGFEAFETGRGVRFAAGASVRERRRSTEREKRTMGTKPSYLGLLNAISNAESQAHAYLSVWADKTPSDEVRNVLRTVAAREGEHGMTFAKRINELGFQLRVKEDAKFEEKMALVAADCSDIEKMERLRLHKLDTGDKPDIFDDFFKDHTIDIRTGELLGRYIAEERDSARLLRSCYEQLKAAAGGAHSNEALRAVEEKVDALCRAVDELRQIVCAQSMPVT